MAKTKGQKKGGIKQGYVWAWCLFILSFGFLVPCYALYRDGRGAEIACTLQLLLGGFCIAAAIGFALATANPKT